MNNTTHPRGIGERIYSDAASFGRFMAWVSAIFGLIISLGLIIGGFYIIFHKSGLIETTGTIKSKQDCMSDVYNKNSCNYTIEYKVNDKKYSTDLYSNNDWEVGTIISIYYHKENPSHATLNKPVPKTVGFILLGVGIFIIAMSLLWLYAVRKYEFAAATQGVATGVNVIRNVL